MVGGEGLLTTLARTLEGAANYVAEKIRFSLEGLFIRRNFPVQRRGLDRQKAPHAHREAFLHENKLLEGLIRLQS